MRGRLGRLLGELARDLFLQAAIRLGILEWNAEFGVWQELITGQTPVAPAEHQKLRTAARCFAERCMVVADAAIQRFREPLYAAPSDRRYVCPECGSDAVELCFPVWVRANEIDDSSQWDLDAEAQPERDSERGWCSKCSSNVLVRRAVEQLAAAGRGQSSEFGNALSGIGRNAAGRNLNTLDQFGPGAGFSGVYDVASGKFLAYPSGNTVLLNGATPQNLVAQFGGHATVNNALSDLVGYTSTNRIGFSMVMDDAGNFSLGWNSGVNARNPSIGVRTAPASVRDQVVNSIKQATGRDAR
jgi:hypothetical protein